MTVDINRLHSPEAIMEQLARLTGKPASYFQMPEEVAAQSMEILTSGERPLMCETGTARNIAAAIHENGGVQEEVGPEVEKAIHAMFSQLFAAFYAKKQLDDWRKSEDEATIKRNRSGNCAAERGAIVNRASLGDNMIELLEAQRENEVLDHMLSLGVTPATALRLLGSTVRHAIETASRILGHNELYSIRGGHEKKHRPDEAITEIRAYPDEVRGDILRMVEEQGRGAAAAR